MKPPMTSGRIKDLKKISDPWPNPATVKNGVQVPSALSIQDKFRLAEVINFGKAFTGQGGQACKRAGAAKQGEADVQEGRTGRPAAPRA